MNKKKAQFGPMANVAIWVAILILIALIILNFYLKSKNGVGLFNFNLY